ncbi:hypothetical protein OG430_26505 [Streptomyces sp. NBC_01304]|nr:hypothetical protein OG430_26505 [Streptomyces sp. NBC_01304]
MQGRAEPDVAGRDQRLRQDEEVLGGDAAGHQAGADLRQDEQRAADVEEREARLPCRESAGGLQVGGQEDQGRGDARAHPEEADRPGHEGAVADQGEVEDRLHVLAEGGALQDALLDAYEGDEQGGTGGQREQRRCGGPALLRALGDREEHQREPADEGHRARLVDARPDRRLRLGEQRRPEQDHHSDPREGEEGGAPAEAVHHPAGERRAEREPEPARGAHGGERLGAGGAGERHREQRAASSELPLAMTPAASMPERMRAASRAGVG